MLKTLTIPVCNECGSAVGDGSGRKEGIILQGFVLAPHIDSGTSRAVGGLLGTGTDADKPLRDVEQQCYCVECFVRICFPRYATDQARRDEREAEESFRRQGRAGY